MVGGHGKMKVCGMVASRLSAYHLVVRMLVHRHHWEMYSSGCPADRMAQAQVLLRAWNPKSGRPTGADSLRQACSRVFACHNSPGFERLLRNVHQALRNGVAGLDTLVQLCSGRVFAGLNRTSERSVSSPSLLMDLASEMRSPKAKLIKTVARAAKSPSLLHALRSKGMSSIWNQALGLGGKSPRRAAAVDSFHQWLGACHVMHPVCLRNWTVEMDPLIVEPEHPFASCAVRSVCTTPGVTPPWPVWEARSASALARCR